MINNYQLIIDPRPIIFCMTIPPNYSIITSGHPFFLKLKKMDDLTILFQASLIS